VHVLLRACVRPPSLPPSLTFVTHSLTLSVWGLRTLAFHVAPVVRVAVSARAEHAAALRAGLRTLAATDPCVVVKPTG